MKDDSVIYAVKLLVMSLLIAIFMCGCESIRWRHHEGMTMITTTEEPLATTITSFVTTTITTINITSTTTTTMVITTTTTEYDPTSRLIDYGWFTGTYYNGETNPCPGGSGRILEDCTPKSGEMKGSVACRRIFEDYGYTVNGRTRVYLEFESYPEMNGWYFVDDCCQSMNVVDVYFSNYETCPWQNDGVTDIHLWMEVS